MCAALPHFYFHDINLCLVYCSWCCALDLYILKFAAYQNLCYLAPLLLGGFVENNLFYSALLMCAALSHFYFSHINLIFVFYIVISAAH